MVNKCVYEREGNGRRGGEREKGVRGGRENKQKGKYSRLRKKKQSAYKNPPILPSPPQPTHPSTNKPKTQKPTTKPTKKNPLIKNPHPPHLRAKATHSLDRTEKKKNPATGAQMSVYRKGGGMWLFGERRRKERGKGGDEGGEALRISRLGGGGKKMVDRVGKAEEPPN